MSETKVLELLAKSRIEVSPETFAVISLSNDDWLELLKNPELSPRMTTPFMIFKDRWEVTLVLDDIDFGTLRHLIRNAQIEKNFRLLSFDVDLAFDVVGFIAQIAKILSEADISILPIASFSRDHILIRQDDLANTLKTLRGFVDEVC
jgi:hypothetical protein